MRRPGRQAAAQARRCGRQLVAFPQPAEELRLLSLQLSCAVFQTRGLALHAEDLLACVLCVPAHGSPPFLDLLAALSGLFQLLPQRARQRLRPFVRRLLLCKLVLHAFALALVAFDAVRRARKTGVRLASERPHLLERPVFTGQLGLRARKRGALPGKPVGTVYLAGADTRTNTGYLMRLTLGGYQDRAIIRTRAALYALDMLRRMALGLDVPESIPFTPQTPNSDLDI